jgi:hypothetical protein
MSSRYGGPRGPQANYAPSQTSHDPNNPFVNPSQQYNDPNQRPYDTESDMGDPYSRRETYISDGSNPAFNEVGQPGYDQYNYENYRACHLTKLVRVCLCER